jgi:hypothetical protein
MKELLNINDRRWISYVTFNNLTSIPLAAQGSMATGLQLDG